MTIVQRLKEANQFKYTLMFGQSFCIDIVSFFVHNREIGRMNYLIVRRADVLETRRVGYNQNTNDVLDHIAF